MEYLKPGEPATEQQRRFNSAHTRVTKAATRPLVYAGAAPAAVIVLQTGLFWPPFAPVFMLPNSIGEPPPLTQGE